VRILLQRVSRAAVRVDGEEIAGIGRGLLLFVGFGREDSAPPLAPLAEKIAGLRVFADDRGRLQHSLRDTGGAVLLVPQFTLYADTSRGRRPDFTGALAPAAATILFDDFVAALRATGIVDVQQGRFGADMRVELCNDGPVTLLLEGRDGKP